jgi:LacI family transcriptional regulator
MSRVTMQQIAQRLGMSQSTVSRVLSGQSKETWASMASRAEHIRLTAARMGYRKNAAAASTRRGRFGSVAFMLASQWGRSSFNARLVDSLHDALEEVKLQLSITRPRAMPDGEISIPRTLRHLMVDALLIQHCNALPRHVIQAVEDHPCPAIWLQRRSEFDSVMLDETAAARALTQRILDLGHRRIVLVDYYEAHHYKQVEHLDPAMQTERRQGYTQAMRAAGLTPRIIDMQTYHDVSTDWLDLSRHWLADPSDRPTAVIQCEGLQTITASLELGLKIPRDLSFAAFIRDPAEDQTGLYVSGTYQNHHALAVAAVEMLLQKIESPATPIPSRRVQYTFNEGRTMAPCKFD